MRGLLALFWKLLERSRADKNWKILHIDLWEEVVFQTIVDSNFGTVSFVSELAILGGLLFGFWCHSSFSLHPNFLDVFLKSFKFIFIFYA